MTDKVQKIRKEVERIHNLLPIMDGDNISINYADRICTTLEMYIDSLQEEPVSEELEEAAEKYAYELCPSIGVANTEAELAFKAGAKWQKEQMMAKAVEGDITFDYYGDDDKTYGCIAHDSFCLEDFGLKDRDEVKVIVIKKD